ncbi:MAG: DUF4197 domain-containing protein [Bacteroidales bacterium]|nr:DUF4197 domain-containing protein [Bacteroidales bacterium]
MKTRILLLSMIILLVFPACDVLQQFTKQTNTPVILTESDIVQGLKEALKVGTNNAISFLGKTDGFLGNSLYKILFPPEVQKVETKLRELGFHQLIDNFIVAMNRGAENAVSKAGPIFVNAILSMTFEDAKNILKGPDNAATEYFRKKTSQQLSQLFKPEIKKALDEVHATKLWEDITTTYNKIPLVTPVQTDLPQYVTDKALQALFNVIAGEEKKIRTDPAARINDILRKVFNPNAIIR